MPQVFLQERCDQSDCPASVPAQQMPFILQKMEGTVPVCLIIPYTV